MGHTTHYEYDEDNDLITVTNPLSGTTVYSYNEYGQVTSVTYENGHTTYYGYDSLGQRVAITDANGHVTTYEYDVLNRLHRESDPLGNTTQYTHDVVGNRLAMTTSNGSTSYEYDAANRLTSVDGVPYTWDNNGNLLSDGTRTFQYDYANRLVQVVSGTLTTEFAYNGDGHRVAKTVNGTETRYTLDTAMGLRPRSISRGGHRLGLAPERRSGQRAPVDGQRQIRDLRRRVHALWGGDVAGGQYRQFLGVHGRVVGRGCGALVPADAVVRARGGAVYHERPVVGGCAAATDPVARLCLR